MSNYNSTLQSNNSDLQAILNVINELPNADSGSGGGSGGGSVETCSLQVTQVGTSFNGLTYTSLENGVVTPNYTTYLGTYDNIIKGSAVTLLRNAWSAANTSGLTLIDTDMANNTIIYRIDDDATLHIVLCYTKNTKITMSDFTVKEVQDITYDDELLVWDFDNGCYTFSKPLWIKQEECALSYYHCIFENGMTLDLVGSDGNCHAVFCLDDNKFEYANNCVGKLVMTQEGASKLVSCELKHEIVEHYNIITDYHINCYANGVLTSSKLNNIYPIKDMVFIKDSRNIIPYNAYEDIPLEYYHGLRLYERKMEDVDQIIENIKAKISKALPR